MSDELKPCPFCGGKAMLLDKPDGGEKTWKVLCDVCLIGTQWRRSTTSIISAWNHRPTPSESKPEKPTPPDIDVTNYHRSVAKKATSTDAYDRCFINDRTCIQIAPGYRMAQTPLEQVRGELAKALAAAGVADRNAVIEECAAICDEANSVAWRQSENPEHSDEVRNEWAAAHCIAMGISGDIRALKTPEPDEPADVSTRIAEAVAAEREAIIQELFKLPINRLFVPTFKTTRDCIIAIRERSTKHATTDTTKETT